MNIWEKITGSDMTKEMKSFESRVKKLPADYQAAWAQINAYLWPHSDFTGRNLMPILDVAAFCDDLINDSKTYADIYQESVDQEVTKALKKVTDKTK
ncbi:DUF1048 domain-containing protein [Cohnella yongneupensis]|uniref:DUF1048 domain-containing protein n=1 Tax=Cohnella yongneupensis TaxID=425006 RepID=A0ABW0QU00_9BACL